jgi:hypothetical protein
LKIVGKYELFTRLDFNSGTIFSAFPLPANELYKTAIFSIILSNKGILLKNGKFAIINQAR